MIVRSARWGLPLLLVAAGLAALQLFLVVRIGPLPNLTFSQITLPAVAFGVGVLAIFAGHVSYPRVQNLRVYLAGYSVGVHTILLALFIGFSSYLSDALPVAPQGLFQFVLLIAIAELYAYTLVPAFPTYRRTRFVTLIVVGAIIIAVSAVRFAPASFAWVETLSHGTLFAPITIVGALLALGCVALNAFLSPASYYLRGAVSGIALLALGGWITEPLLAALGLDPVSDHIVTLLYALFVSVFFLIAIVAHVLARMEHRARYDPLLQIYNREHCDSILAERSNMATKPPTAVLMIDIDRFKQVNDTYGHQVGDRVLFAVSQEIQKLIVPDGTLCRYGGEELIAFFPGRAGRDIVPLAQRVRLAVEQLETVSHRHRISVTVSMGLAERRELRDSLQSVVRAADKALYMAKENGRNQLKFVRIRR